MISTVFHSTKIQLSENKRKKYCKPCNQKFYLTIIFFIVYLHNKNIKKDNKMFAIYRKTLNNLNDIVERQSRRIDKLEMQFKNKQCTAVHSVDVKSRRKI